MILAYVADGARLKRLPPDADPARALWIDLFEPTDAEVAAIGRLGVTEVPTLADMEEIEVSSRLYREGGADYMTVVLPGASGSSAPISGPVCFILTRERLITVRHHAPRPFETYPDRADRVGTGCASAHSIFVSLMDEVVGRLADILEGIGAALDAGIAKVFREGDQADDETLQDALRRIALQSDLLGRVRLSLLTLERAIGAYVLWSGNEDTPQTRGDPASGSGGAVAGFGAGRGAVRDDKALRSATRGLAHDLSALEVHADYLNSRLAMATDVTLGMVNLAQNRTVKIVSVVAVIFLPPTVIASAYGMNFRNMPELDWTYGYPMAIGMMIASTVITYLIFRWRKWL